MSVRSDIRRIRELLEILVEQSPGRRIIIGPPLPPEQQRADYDEAKLMTKIFQQQAQPYASTEETERDL